MRRSAASRSGLRPPGPVRWTKADVPHSQARGTLPARRTAGIRSWRGPLAILSLLLCVLVAGVYYALVDHQPAQVEPVAQAAHKATGANKSIPSKAGQNEAPTKMPEAVRSSAATMDQQKSSAEGEEGKQVAAAAATPVLSAEPLGLYSERTRAHREQWIAKLGGTPESELGVAAGLDWLARHQAEDGHWGPDCLGPDGSRCEKQHPCGGPGMKYEAALTGLAVLAFQAGGNYDFNGRPYSHNVRRGLDSLVARQGPSGEIVGSLSGPVSAPGAPRFYDIPYMYEHAIATFALAEACAVARGARRHADEKYLAAATKAVQFIADQQHDDGGWRYQPTKTQSSDASVSGWAMLALKTAMDADLPVDKTVVSQMVAFFKKLADPLTGRTRYQATQRVSAARPGIGTTVDEFMPQQLTPELIQEWTQMGMTQTGSDALTGIGMMVDEFVLKQPKSDLILLAAPYLADGAEQNWGRQPGRSDFYLWYNCTLAMFQAAGEPWKRWNGVVRDHVIKLQLHGPACARGSWDPESRWGVFGGRIYTTALAVLTLEVYYRFARDSDGQN